MVTSCLALTLAVGHLRQEPKTLQDPQFDNALYKGYADLYNANVAYESATERGAVVAVLPPTLDKRTKTAAKSVETLKTIKSGKPEREELRQKLVYSLESFVSINNLLIGAYKLAEEKRVWTADAAYKADQAQAIYREKLKENPLASFFTFLRADANWDFRNRCPDELMTVLDLVKSKAGFDFGVINYTDVDPRSFTVVLKGLVAANLGFRSGDLIQSIDGKNVDDLEQLKMQIKRLKGKTTKAVVKRDGKSETLQLTIPENFTSKKETN